MSAEAMQTPNLGLISIQEEQPFEILDELKDLFRPHWEEVGIDKDLFALDPDYNSYATADKANMLTLVTVRDDGQLVGYALFIVMKRAHYKDVLAADCDAYWLNPDYRGARVGSALLTKSEEILRDKGVRVIHNRCKLHGDLDFDAFFRKLGYTPVERLYRKVID